MALKNLTRDSFKWTNGRGHDQKPILYSVKNNSLGLGKSLHIAQTDNWWERAFDNSLKSLSVSETQDGGIKVVQEEVKGGGVGLKQIVAMGKGRYVERIKFVKGGLLEGTLRELKTEVAERVVGEDVVVETMGGVSNVERGKKRKRGGGEVVVAEEGESKDGRRKRWKEEKAAVEKAAEEKAAEEKAAQEKAAKKLKRQQRKEREGKKARKTQEKERRKKLKSTSKPKLLKLGGEEETAMSATTSPLPTKKQKGSSDKALLPTPPSSGEEYDQVVAKKSKRDKKDKTEKQKKKLKETRKKKMTPTRKPNSNRH